MTTAATATLVSAPVQEPQTAPADVIEVVVSLRHINQGNHYPTGCAVALALEDRGFQRVSVGGVWVYVDGDYFVTPPELAAWFRAYDNDKSSVAPERFLLRRAA